MIGFLLQIPVPDVEVEREKETVDSIIVMDRKILAIAKVAAEVEEKEKKWEDWKEELKAARETRFQAMNDALKEFPYKGLKIDPETGGLRTADNLPLHPNYIEEGKLQFIRALMISKMNPEIGIVPISVNSIDDENLKWLCDQLEKEGIQPILECHFQRQSEFEFEIVQL